MESKIGESISRTLGNAYFFLILVFSLCLAKGIITVQTGIIPFSLILAILCFLYSFLLTWDQNTFDRFFFQLSGIAVLIRLILCFCDPLWEDDWARYLWEGQLVHLGISPYIHPPNFYFNSDAEIFSNASAISILSKINHPDWTTIYFPLNLLYFSFISSIVPYSLLLLKLSYIALDCLIVYFIQSLNGRKSAILYFFFPILIREVYINAHFEIICIFLIVLSYYKLVKNQYFLAFFSLGLTIHSKIYFILFLPIFLIQSVKVFNFKNLTSYRNLLKYSCFSFVGFLFPFFILEIFIPNNHSFDFSNILLFSSDFEFNSTIFLFVHKTFGKVTARFVSLLILVYFIFSSFLNYKIIAKNHKRILQWMFSVFLLFLLLTPVSNPWYFLVLCPIYFLTRNETKDSLWLIILIPQLAYLTFTNLHIPALSEPTRGFYDLPFVVILLEFLGFIYILKINSKKISILLYILSNIVNSCKYLRLPYGRARKPK
ncbi:MAG: hypothetical protein O9264_01485 [Leptospira sp.]|nr:hypothetical protein [Leptospira sp.]